MAEKRFRLKFMFWLDVTKTDENDVAEQIEELKATRKFTQTIRDGIRLICDLRQGRVEVLFELFPWVKAEFLTGIHSPETAGERAIQAHLERIERQLLQQGNLLLQPPMSLPASTGGIKSMMVPALKAPSFDDDDETMEIKKDTLSRNSSKNFLEALANI